MHIDQEISIKNAGSFWKYALSTIPDDKTSTFSTHIVIKHKTAEDLILYTSLSTVNKHEENKDSLHCHYISVIKVYP